jgi:hypothetical protein
MKPAFLDDYLQPALAAASAPQDTAPTRDLYFDLYNNPDEARSAGAAFLEQSRPTCRPASTTCTRG